MLHPQSSFNAFALIPNYLHCWLQLSSRPLKAPEHSGSRTQASTNLHQREWVPQFATYRSITRAYRALPWPYFQSRGAYNANAARRNHRTDNPTHRVRMGLQVADRSEEHTSELQSLRHLVCRLLLEKKNGA